jgi:hypothetical protein
MAVFLISYELRKSDFDYQPLLDALHEIGAKRIQEYIWGVRIEWSSEHVFDHLWAHMNRVNDRLLVVHFESSDGYKSHNAINKLSTL